MNSIFKFLKEVVHKKTTINKYLFSFILISGTKMSFFEFDYFFSQHTYQSIKIFDENKFIALLMRTKYDIF